MQEKSIQKQLDAMQKQLAFVTEELQAQRKTRRELEELKADLSLIGRDVFQAAIEEMDGVAQHLDTGDIMFFFKKLLRNIHNLSRLLDKVESMADFADNAAPLTKEMINSWMEKLDEFDRKGYFEFSREAIKIVDTIVTSFEVEDIRLLRENITSILLTVKNLTQPEMLSSLNNALSFYRYMSIKVEKNVSIWKILKELRDPEMRRGIIYLIQFLKNMAGQNGNHKNKPKTNQSGKGDVSHGNQNNQRQNGRSERRRIYAESKPVD